MRYQVSVKYACLYSYYYQVITVVRGTYLILGARILMVCMAGCCRFLLVLLCVVYYIHVGKVLYKVRGSTTCDAGNPTPLRRFDVYTAM
jgi:hypothetical protein